MATGRCGSTDAAAVGLKTSLFSAFPMMLGATTAGAVDGLGRDLPLAGVESSRAMSNCVALLGLGAAADGFGLDLPLGACVGTGTGTTEAAEGLGGAMDGGTAEGFGGATDGVTVTTEAPL